MTVSILAVIVGVLGALVYALSANPKLQEIGRIMFFCGLFVALWLFGGMKITIP